MALGGNDFNAIRISLASPEQIRVWSYGEVTKPETINYRTLRPEKDGLFCERIFGPTKDWECYCGKYKKIRFKGVLCDRCGVEVARAKVRRERMGHISLAAPVAHIWFSKGTPSRLGLLLDLSPRNLDRVLYFAQYLVTDVDRDLVEELIDELNDKLDEGLDKIEEGWAPKKVALKAQKDALYESLGERLAAFMEWRDNRDANTFEIGESEEAKRWRGTINRLNDERERNKALLAELAHLRARRARAKRRVTHYDTLGVSRWATPAEIDFGYRKQMGLYLQDRDPDDPNIESVPANEQTPEIISAYEVLRDPKKRREYDFRIATERTDAVKPLNDEINGVKASIAESDGAIKELEYVLAEAVEAIFKLGYNLAQVVESMRFLEIEEMARRIDGDMYQTELDEKEARAQLEDDFNDAISELENLNVGNLLTESKFRELRDGQAVRHIQEKYELFSDSEYRDLLDNFRICFKAGMGAEAALEVLKGLDLDTVRDDLQEEMQATSGQRRKKAIKRMRVVEAFRKSGNMAEWMIMTALPVLPPELRPMVQLDGGRFATSDLNDLYRRVINRNNRLKRLMDLGAPEIIVRNEKRMLQEAVDALVDNGRRGRAVAGSHNHRLKSLSDLLRGKQGRFRQNLLGKRVDYSGRSVIIAGPELKLHQCGLPRRMALELFKPFVMNRLVMKGYAQNIKSAKRMSERISPQVWDILEEAVGERPVLLNRAPTLHRLGIQAFEPVLIDGSAIQLHPLVCTAFNADFDGDQMAVHVPLSSEAVMEARQMMLSSLNMLSPSSGEPIVAPHLDIALGSYYMTMVNADPKARGAGRKFRNFDDARLAHDLGSLDLRASIDVRVDHDMEIIRPDENNGDARVKIHAGDSLRTTAGRIIFNETLPADLPFYNKEVERGALKDVSTEVFKKLGKEKTADVLDNIKRLGFEYATKSGITIAINDIEIPPEKDEIVENAQEKLDSGEEDFMNGLITEYERYRNIVEIWADANTEVTGVVADNLSNYGGIHLMASSGAKGNIAQIKQMAGMRGPIAGPRGQIMERPIKASFREGLSVLEYFLSAHGARKGLTDTALNTASSGYLTRRLIDVAQEVIILSEDCETQNGVWITKDDIGVDVPSFADQIKTRYLAEAVADPNTGEILLDRNELLSEDSVDRLEASGVDTVNVRSPMTCDAQRGICKTCYGLSLATLEPSMIGEAVGIMAAQSIGEPGTQLTMRTFRVGGAVMEARRSGLGGEVAERGDITSGLPRVEELFEARVPKMEAVLSEIDGMVEVEETGEGLLSIRVSSEEEYEDEYVLPPGFTPMVESGATVFLSDRLAEPVESAEIDDEALALANEDVIARVSGIASVNGDRVTITWSDTDLREYIIPAAASVSVKTGEMVDAGQALTRGPKNPQEVLRIQGRDSVQRYLIDEVQKVYRLQGVPIHNKHLELIVAQMLRKVRIDAPGDTELLPGEYMDRQKYEEANANVLAAGGEPAMATPILLGITRASLNTDSFLAAASFQETTRVLTESAVNGQIDQLRGLKENVIIGRLIPARLNPSEDGVSGLSLEEANAAPSGMGQMTTGAKGPAYQPPTIVPVRPDPAFDDPSFADEFIGQSIVEPDDMPFDDADDYEDAPYEGAAVPSDDD